MKEHISFLSAFVVLGFAIFMINFGSHNILKTQNDYLVSAKEITSELSAPFIYNNYLETNSKDVVFLDIREKDELKEGMIPGARWIPRGVLEFKIESIIPKDEKRTIIVYSETGERALLATKLLKEMGYKAVSMKGGIREWMKNGFPITFQ